MMRCFGEPAADARGRTLLILLPPARASAEAFVTHGWIDAVRRRLPGVDPVAVDADVDRYTHGTVLDDLETGVIEPARAAGYRRLWLAGVSLGGFGSLRYAAQSGDGISGLLLVAPYLGARPDIKAIRAAGGWNHGFPPIDATDADHRMLSWLARRVAEPDRAPPIFVGLGDDDRFAPWIRILTEALPPERVRTCTGGHDWTTWTTLWHALLDQAAPMLGPDP
ncbi:MAG: alpha/beta hydrolase [Burkholderiales bacterium]|nr:alpha/beta hydrolase [Burkholderiales bacterium]